MSSATGKPWWRRWFGSRSERAAEKYLRNLGYRIVARNFSCSQGELDLVALDDSCIVFAEVRSTEAEDLQKPAVSVDETKQKKLTAAAMHFLQRKRLLGQAARFDVLTVSWPADRTEPAIEHHQNAFEALGRFQMFH